MTIDRSRSEAYLKEVQRTGGTLTPEQSEIYEKICIEEGHPYTTAATRLESLQEIQRQKAARTPSEPS